MSVRRFAAHLGVNPAAVSNWERRGAESRLRYETQEMLDTDLAMAPAEVRERFDQGLAEETTTTANERRSPRGGQEPRGQVAVPTTSLGDRSRTRTTAIVAALRAGDRPHLRYTPPVDVAQLTGGFLASPARVFLVQGPPGCGKTSLVFHVAETVCAADFQLLTADHWLDGGADLATEVLRYGSTAVGSDALLTLEREGSALTRPLVVIIDSPRQRSVAEQLCRDLDAILRQVLTDQLRFIMVFRAPVGIELARFPVLAAAVMPSHPGTWPSLELDRWDLATAREVWQRSRTPDEPPFDALPAQIKALARLPLYMHLAKVAGSIQQVGQSNSYRLVEFCVRTIIEAAGWDVAETSQQLSDLSRREMAGMFTEAVPEALTAVSRSTPVHDLTPLPGSPLLRHTSAGQTTFEHDVVREYFFAAWLARSIEARGRSTQTIEAINYLADRTAMSADLYGTFEFLLQHLDAYAPELLATVAQSPTISITAALPLILGLAGENAAFASRDVLQVCASRCLHDNGLALARALLRHDTMPNALGSEYPRWLLRVLRRFGASVWSEIISCVETQLPEPAVRQFVTLANLDAVEDAVFFARHFYAFFGDDAESRDRINTLLSHPDWRVRAAVADGIRQGQTTNRQVIAVLVAPLTHDRDYKVRAAVASATGHLATLVARHHLETLLADPSWHVRERLLAALAARSSLTDEVAELLVGDEQHWQGSPSNVRVAVQRLLLSTGRGRLSDDESHGRALFGLLREIRSDALHPAADIRQQLAAAGLDHPNWFVQREAAAVATAPNSRILDIRTKKEAFRRLRDRRSVQIALDTQDVQRAIAVATAAARAGAQFIEVGDPLIKTVGVNAIARIKRAVPDRAVVAEMMSADWGRDQVVLAAEAGADVVLLIGPASLASVSAAVDASKKLAVPLVIDVPEGRLAQGWVQDMERAGVDGFAITTNIDLGVAGFHPLDQVQLLRSWTKLPIAASGGFEPMDPEAKRRHSWDILIVGRGITDAVDPAAAAHDLITFIAPDGQGLPQ
ncbi:MAG: HEAT repeat domain-containing protein [Micromonosporaceae bacterium]|nr:HEAT repeat domain-containing protein [Micromonosporaceae bacterium]